MFEFNRRMIWFFIGNTKAGYIQEGNITLPAPYDGDIQKVRSNHIEKQIGPLCLGYWRD